MISVLIRDKEGAPETQLFMCMMILTIGPFYYYFYFYNSSTLLLEKATTTQRCVLKITQWAMKEVGRDGGLIASGWVLIS